MHERGTEKEGNCIITLIMRGYIDGTRAVYRISLSFRGPQMNMCRLIDEVSVYLQNRSNCHITLLYKKVIYFAVLLAGFLTGLYLYIHIMHQNGHLFIQHANLD